MVRYVVALLNTIYVYLKNLLTSVFGSLFKQDPELELNKPLASNSNGLKQKKFIEDGIDSTSSLVLCTGLNHRCFQLYCASCFCNY